MTPNDPPPLVGISIFDLDRTITRRGTWSSFLLFAAWHRAPWRLALVPAVVAVMAGYKARLISRKRLKEIMHLLMIGKAIPRAEVDALGRAFARHILANNIYPQAIVLIARELAAGRRVMIASAAPRIYLAPLAHTLGIKDVIGTRSTWQSDMLMPPVDGANCYGKEKCAMVIERLRKLGFDRAAIHIRFYSDDVSDQPTFDWSDEPVAVNPSNALMRHARAEGWTILDWRQKARRTKSAARDSARTVPRPSRLASRTE